MCAECHSTGVRKNYDAANDRFATTWAEISVGCEACHGQGSRHVAWARERQSWWPFGKTEDPAKGLLVRFDERRDRRLADRSQDRQRDARTSPRRRCARRSRPAGCATRAAASSPRIGSRADGCRTRIVVAPLSRGLYHADGQMLDEVYNYGSFKQSKMFAAGVTCSDCHEPHGARLRLPGDGVCLQCHASDKYAAATHHHHEGANPPLACASCHMPARTYMVVDRRHDHSFRIPRPDLSAKLGTPNACNDCHADKSAEWAAAAIERWHGPDRKGFQNYAEAFHAAWADQPDAGALLAAVASDRTTPAIRPRQRADRACLACVGGEHRSGPEGSRRSRPHGAHRRPRHARSCTRCADLAAGLAAVVRLQSGRAPQGRCAAGRGSDRKPASCRP